MRVVALTVGDVGYSIYSDFTLYIHIFRKNAATGQTGFFPVMRWPFDV
jgi:hypothetical protein